MASEMNFLSRNISINIRLNHVYDWINSVLWDGFEFDDAFLHMLQHPIRDIFIHNQRNFIQSIKNS